MCALIITDRNLKLLYKLLNSIASFSIDFYFFNQATNKNFQLNGILFLVFNRMLQLKRLRTEFCFLHRRE